MTGIGGSPGIRKNGSQSESADRSMHTGSITNVAASASASHPVAVGPERYRLQLDPRHGYAAAGKHRQRRNDDDRILARDDDVGDAQRDSPRRFPRIRVPRPPGPAHGECGQQQRQDGGAAVVLGHRRGDRCDHDVRHDDRCDHSVMDPVGNRILPRFVAVEGLDGAGHHDAGGPDRRSPARARRASLPYPRTHGRADRTRSSARCWRLAPTGVRHVPSRCCSPPTGPSTATGPAASSIAIAAGDVVISDRCIASSLAYQSLDVPCSTTSRRSTTASPLPGLRGLPDHPGRALPGTVARPRGSSRQRFDAAATQRRVLAAYEHALGSVAGARGDGSPDRRHRAAREEVFSRLWPVARTRLRSDRPSRHRPSRGRPSRDRPSLDRPSLDQHGVAVGEEPVAVPTTASSYADRSRSRPARAATRATSVDPGVCRLVSSRVTTWN